jgi:hypothetical protein
LRSQQARRRAAEEQTAAEQLDKQAAEADAELTAEANEHDAT